MKNNTVRVPHNNRKSPVRSQGKRPALARPILDEVNLGICVHWRKRGKLRTKILVNDIGITESEWGAACAQNRKQASAGNFFGAAIREKLAVDCPPTAKKDTDTINRAVTYEKVMEYIGDFDDLEKARDGTADLLMMGVTLLHLLATNDAASNMAVSYAKLVMEAKHRLTVAVNELSASVYNIEPRVDMPWQTTQGQQLLANATAKAVAS